MWHTQNHLNGDQRAAATAMRRLAAIVESASDAIIGISLDGTIESWNKAAEHLFGYSESEAGGQAVSILLPPDFEDELPELLKRIRAGETIEAYEAVRARKDGVQIAVSLTLSPILDETGAIAGAATIARDWTRRKQQEEFVRTRSVMEASTMLAGGVAHDLNNLMTAVMGHAELLAEAFRNHPGAQESLDAILTSAQMAGRLAHELLAYARGGRYQSALISLNDIASSILRVQASTLRSGCNLQQDLAADLPNIEADPTQMNHVVLNLMLNAIEAVGPQGEIAVKTQTMEVDGEYAAHHTGLQPGTYAVLSVTDSGDGMDAEVLSQVFKPFYSTKATGRGLGLAAAYGIVKNHGGYIEARSTVGEGSCFTVYLPATTREAGVAGDTPLSRAGGHETILVVDDEAQILMINRRILEAHGYHVLTARDGAEAFRVATEFSGDIHLVVLDMAMPVMDGAKAFSLIKQVRPSCKVIISSGYGLNDVTRSLLDAGADAILQKPFHITDLTAEVRRLLDLK